MSPGITTSATSDRASAPSTIGRRNSGLTSTPPRLRERRGRSRRPSAPDAIPTTARRFGSRRNAMPSAQRHQDREDEDPEDRLRLADELAQPHERQLDEGGTADGYWSRRCLPVSEHEDVLERRAVGRQRGEHCAARVERREQRGHREVDLGGADGRSRSPVTRERRGRRAARAAPRSTALARVRDGELDDVLGAERRDRARAACRARSPCP